MNHRDIDWQAIRERVAHANAEVSAAADEEPQLETYDQIRERFEGRESSEIAARMFRH